jgi:hypothetical protein
MKKEEAKFMRWLRREMKRGLIDMHVDVDRSKPIDREYFFKQMNAVNKAIANSTKLNINDSHGKRTDVF